MPAHELADLGECCARLLLALADELLGALRVGVDALARKPEVDREPDQSRLRAVVEIALDAAELARLDVEHGRSTLPERLDLAPELAALRRAQQTGHDLAVQSDDDLRQRCGDEQQDHPATGPSDASSTIATGIAREPLEPEGQGQRHERHGPRDTDDDELDDRQREVRPRRRGRRASAPRRRTPHAGCRGCRREAADTGADGSIELTDEYAPALDPGDEPRSFDGERDEHDADPGQQRPSGRSRPGRRRCRRRASPTNSPTMIAPFAYQVVGWIGESRNARSGERAIPGRAKLRSTGDAGRAEPGEDEQQPCRQDDRLDHVRRLKSVDSSALARSHAASRRRRAGRRSRR